MTLTTKVYTETPNESLINSDQYVKIWGFMLKDLKLEKTELMVYAVIFSMYKYNFDSFNGSREYLQRWTNAGKSAIDNALNSLVRKKLLIKTTVYFGRSARSVFSINTDMLPECDMFESENRFKRSREKYEQRTSDQHS